VAKGDTLYRLSKQYGVTVDDLKAWNNLVDNTIHVGQEIIVSNQ
jgi:LysM repeat protein